MEISSAHYMTHRSHQKRLLTFFFFLTIEEHFIATRSTIVTSTYSSRKRGQIDTFTMPIGCTPSSNKMCHKIPFARSPQKLPVRVSIEHMSDGDNFTLNEPVWRDRSVSHLLPNHQEVAFYNNLNVPLFIRNLTSSDF